MLVSDSSLFGLGGGGEESILACLGLDEDDFEEFDDLEELDELLRLLFSIKILYKSK